MQPWEGKLQKTGFRCSGGAYHSSEGTKCEHSFADPRGEYDVHGVRWAREWNFLAGEI